MFQRVFPAGPVAGSVAAWHRITNAYRVSLLPLDSGGRLDRCGVRVGARDCRNYRGGRKRGGIVATCALSYMSTRVRACLRAGACMRACQWSRLAEEYVRLRRFSARVTPAFSSFGSLPFFLRTLHSPFSPFSVSRDRCSSTLLVTSSRVHRARFETLRLSASRNFTRPNRLAVFSVSIERHHTGQGRGEGWSRRGCVTYGTSLPRRTTSRFVRVKCSQQSDHHRGWKGSRWKTRDLLLVCVYTFPGVSKCACASVLVVRVQRVYTRASLYVYTLRFTCGACAAPSDDSRAPTSCGVGVSVAMKTIGYLWTVHAKLLWNTNAIRKMIAKRDAFLWFYTQFRLSMCPVNGKSNRKIDRIVVD